MVVFWFQVEVIYIDCIPIECYGTKAIVFTVAYENRGGYKNLNSIVNRVHCVNLMVVFWSFSMIKLIHGVEFCIWLISNEITFIVFS